MSAKVGDYFIYLGDYEVGYTKYKKYKITEIGKYNGYFNNDDGITICYHLKETYTDRNWKFISNNEIRKQKLEKINKNIKN